MFTGIIQDIGTFQTYRHGKQEMTIEAPRVSENLEIGESLAVNGVCLTLARKEKGRLSFHLSQETLRRTNLGNLRRGDKLNLERALTPSEPLGGHLVTGHIDTTGKVLSLRPIKPGVRMKVSFPSDLKPLFVPKGSVALNGVSLTIAAVASTSFEVELIPVTLKKSNLGLLKRGDAVNIECDIIGKYVYNWLSRTKL
ncbi:MAG: riboflavin synthase [Candidatus Aminicenantales bacterium]